MFFQVENICVKDSNSTLVSFGPRLLCRGFEFRMSTPRPWLLSSFLTASAVLQLVRFSSAQWTVHDDFYHRPQVMERKFQWSLQLFQPLKLRRWKAATIGPSFPSWTIQILRWDILLRHAHRFMMLVTSRGKMQLNVSFNIVTWRSSCGHC